MPRHGSKSMKMPARKIASAVKARVAQRMANRPVKTGKGRQGSKRDK